MKKPKLRTVEKVKPPYPLGHFPSDFAFKIGKEIVYKLATSEEHNIEGEEWERIFSLAINAQWKPSNVGLDDVVKGVCAWGAKSVKNSDPFKAKIVRLISGRNSPAYSFDSTNLDVNPEKIGRMVLQIWNGRVESLRNKYSHLRSIVLIKSADLTEFVVFEKDTVNFPLDKYDWRWNDRKNLEGFEKEEGEHRFTWQPHGSQFTIIEDVPENKLSFRIRKPEKIDPENLLKAVGFDKSWVQVIKNKVK